MKIGRFSLLSLLSVGLTGIGCLFHVIGLSVVYWLVTDPFISGYGYGLWLTCTPKPELPQPTGLTPSPCHSSTIIAEGVLKLTQAFVIIGFLLGAGSFILSIVFLFKKVKVLGALSFIVGVCAVGSILLAVTIFGASTITDRHSRQMQLGWGFILSTVSTVFFIFGGIMGLVEVCTQRETGQPQTVYSHAGVIMNTRNPATGQPFPGQAPPATITP